MTYEVSKKSAGKSDIGLGSWTKLLEYIPKKNQAYNVLFRLSGMTQSDKTSGTNNYRFSSLVVYYNSTHYTFETYSKSSGTPVLLQKSVAVGKLAIENQWNLVFFGYSRKNKKATGFVKLTNGENFNVEFTDVVQDAPLDKMEVLFYGDNMYNGFNGKVSSPEVLNGNNFLQTFGKADHKAYFKLNEL